MAHKELFGIMIKYGKTVQIPTFFQTQLVIDKND